MSRIGKLVVATGVALAAVPLVGGPADAQPTPALVTVVHGLRGVVADVYLDGVQVLETFEPERSTDPLPIPPGVHTVDVRLAGSPPDSSPAVRGTLDIPEGARLSAVVGLTSSGEPTITTYPDDLAPVAAGQARVVVRHAAAAPAVDVLVDAAPVVPALDNRQEGAAQVTAGLRSVATNATGSATIVTPPQNVPLAEGTATSMYLIGSQADASVTWVAVQTAGVGTAPNGIPTGNSGLADGAGSSFPTLPVAAASLGAIALATFGARRARLRT